MMMFRRLYWVAEQVEKDGSSKVTGVFTSIQDLVHTGLQWCSNGKVPKGYRLTLMKPDSFNCPLGVFESPRFEGLDEALTELVQGNEYSSEEAANLRSELDSFSSSRAG